MITRIPARITGSVVAGAITLALYAFSMACGGSSPGGPSSVTIISRDTGSTGAIGATITITSGGVSPSSVTIGIGQSVTFINNDTRSHEMASNPHPNHGSCPSMENGLGSMPPNTTRSTRGFADAGTCSFHDHLDSENRSLQGSITIR